MSITEPSKILTPWASTGSKNPIPANANNTTGAAGFDKGFPDITMTPEEAGGLPPDGQDFNGIFYQITEIIQYIQAGGQPFFSAALSSAIGGYPKGCVILGADAVTLWQNQVDNNTSDPNSTPTGWLKVDVNLKSVLASGSGASMIGRGSSTVDEDLTEIERSPTKNAVSPANANLSAFDRLYVRNNIVVIGDSITAGVGASVPQFGYAGLLGQALANLFQDGYGYPIVRNNGPASYLWTHNGEAGNAGLSGSSISLNGPAQYIRIKPSEGVGVVAYVEVLASTATTIQLEVNGVVVATAALSGAVFKAFLQLQKGVSWTSADDVRVTCPSGTLVVSGVAPVRYGNAVILAVDTSPLVITCGASGQSFEYFRTNKAQAAAMSSDFSGSGASTYIIALGTNSIYNSVQAQTPAQYVASMLGLEADLVALNPNIGVIFTIPPQANESIWPVIKPGVTYTDYVEAIRAAIPPSKLIDLNVYAIPYADGVHPTDVGHIAIARRICDEIGVPFDVETPQLRRTEKLTGASPVIIENGYVSRDVHGVKLLAGRVLPNGAGTDLLATIPNAYRPSVDRYCTIPLLGSSNGVGTIHINATNGEIRLIYNSVTWASLYLDGVSFL